MILPKKYLYLFIFLTQLFRCSETNHPQLMIATAANMQFAMEKLVEAFEAESGIPCEIILGSSGKLTAQIREGAPFDVFASANMKYPNELYQSGFTTATPTIYALGQLVLWSLDTELALSIESLKNAQYIALANPKTAPYGVAAVDVLQHYQLLASLKDRLVYGESIAQTNQFILSGAASVGFTAKSVVMAASVEGRGQWLDIDETLYKPIEQGVVILKSKDAGKLAAAQKFHDFLLSPKAKEILITFGYKIKE